MVTVNRGDFEDKGRVTGLAIIVSLRAIVVPIRGRDGDGWDS